MGLRALFVSLILFTILVWSFCAIMVILSPPAHGDVITAYSPDEPDSRQYHDKNCLGFPVLKKVEGCRQAATDHRHYPLGSILLIDGIGRVIVTDCGSAVRGRHVDVVCANRHEVRRFPTGHAQVQVVRRGWGDGGMYPTKHLYCGSSARTGAIYSSKRGYV